MTAEEAITHLMSGGKCTRKGQPYIVIYKDGKFMIEDTGTLVGNLNGLEKLEITNG